ncbi:MAG: uridine kinase family protein [Propionibacteriaceae bacterium]
MTQRQLILLAGPSGSGKSRLVEHSSVVGFRLDDFYRDADAPDLPQTLGIVDWDDVRSWDLMGAADALAELLYSGSTHTPVYSISLSQRTGSQTMSCAADSLIIAEGIFAIELLAELQRREVAVTAIYLDRPRLLTFWLRLSRDLREHRKPPHVLIRRGLALLRHDPQLRQHAIAVGFSPLSMKAALTLVAKMSRTS